MISAHNVPYALKCIRNIFKQKIRRPSCFSQPGNFKEESTSGIVKSLSPASERKCLAGESSAQQVEVWQVSWVDLSGVWIVSLLLPNVVDGAVAGVGILVDLAVSYTLETACAGQPSPEAADTREHIKIADQVISSSSWSVRKKPRMSSSTSLASCCTDFSLVG